MPVLRNYISCVPARERTQGPGRVTYMGSAVPDCTKQPVRGQDQVTLQSSINVPHRENQHSLNYIQHKDARGRNSVTDAKVMATDNQNA